MRVPDRRFVAVLLFLPLFPVKEEKAYSINFDVSHVLFFS
jgi:hypothetical protein